MNSFAKFIPFLFILLSLFLLYFNKQLLSSFGLNENGQNKKLKLYSGNNAKSDYSYVISNEDCNVSPVSNLDNKELSSNNSPHIEKKLKIKPTIAPFQSKVTAEESIKSNEKVIEDFKQSLSNKDENSLPDIKILKVVESQESTTKPSLSPDSIRPAINLTALTPPYTLNKQDRRLRGLMFQKFRGSQRISWSVYSEVTDKKDNGEVTLIVVGEKGMNYHHYVDVWSDPIIFIVSGPISNETQLVQSIERSDLPNRVETILCLIQKGNVYSDHFPVNILRNVGLMQSSTSLVFVIDSSRSLSKHLLNDIKKTTITDYSIMIVPTVFTERNDIRTKEDVQRCIVDHQCRLTKLNERTHNYVHKNWLHDESPSLPVSCLQNLELEPSFVMKISSILPFYHEGFIDYGFNQISFFEHIRLRGFRMSLLGNSFLITSQQEWSVYKEVFNRQSILRGNSSMEILYNALKSKWMNVYKDIDPISKCD